MKSVGDFVVVDIDCIRNALSFNFVNEKIVVVLSRALKAHACTQPSSALVAAASGGAVLAR